MASLKTARTFRRLVAEMVAASPRRAVGSVVLMVAMSFTEGLGLLLLMPLLGLIGVEEPNTLPRATGWFAAGFRLVGLQPTLASVLTLFVAIAGLRVVLQRWRIGLSAAVQESFTSALRVRVYRAIASAEWRFLVGRRGSEFAQVLTSEIGRVGSAASQAFGLLVVLTVSLVYVGLAIHLSPAVALLVLLSAGALAWTVRGTLDRSRTSGARAAEARRDLYAGITEHLGSMKTAKSYGAVDRHVQEFVRLSDELRDVSLEVTAEESDLQRSLDFGSTVLLAFIVFVSLEVLKVPAAPMLLLLFTFSRLLPRMVTIYRRVQGLVGALPVYEAVTRLEHECLQAAEHPPAAPSGLALTRSLRFEDVSFAYLRGADEQALSHVTLEIPAGRTTAIVGPSGSGKSTMADLLIGLLLPTSGAITVDGQPLTAAALSEWREHVSYVPQDTFLFHDTIRANLTWVRSAAADEALWRVLRLASADQFVRALPHGLDTVVGERGVMLSGGERQRLSLARALLRRPRVLVLDEATSSLDSENELRIQQAIEGLHQQMTIVVITHRLSTIRQADAIHVVDHGRLVESGSWMNLMGRRDGRFRRLCVAQGIDERPQGRLASAR